MLGKKKNKKKAESRPLAFGFEPDLLADLDESDVHGQTRSGEWIPIPNEVFQQGSAAVREFASGATRDTDEGKPEYGGFLAWEVLERFGKYMHAHRFQKDGTMRASDNWKKGIPESVYRESLFRHFIDVLALTEGDIDWCGNSEPLEDALCAMLFNVQGLLYETLKGRVGRQ